MLTWDIEDICGTLYSKTPTTVNDLRQTLLWAENWLGYYQMPDAYRNMAGIVSNFLRTVNWDSKLNITARSFEPYGNDGNFEGVYCGWVTSEKDGGDKDRLFARWSQIFDLQLHDAAVTYMHMAAHEPDKDKKDLYLRLSFNFWVFSRQLRVDELRDQMRQQA